MYRKFATSSSNIWYYKEHGEYGRISNKIQTIGTGHRLGERTDHKVEHWVWEEVSHLPHNVDAITNKRVPFCRSISVLCNVVDLSEVLSVGSKHHLLQQLAKEGLHRRAISFRVTKVGRLLGVLLSFHKVFEEDGPRFQTGSEGINVGLHESELEELLQEVQDRETTRALHAANVLAQEQVDEFREFLSIA